MCTEYFVYAAASFPKLALIVSFSFIPMVGLVPMPSVHHACVFKYWYSYGRRVIKFNFGNYFCKCSFDAKTWLAKNNAATTREDFESLKRRSKNVFLISQEVARDHTRLIAAMFNLTRMQSHKWLL